MWSQWAAREEGWRRGGGRQTIEGTGLGLGLLRRREQVGPQVKRAGDLATALETGEFTAGFTSRGMI